MMMTTTTTTMHETSLLTPETRVALQQAQEALQWHLDEDMVRDYRQAVAAVPELVEQESPLLSFLRAEQYNPALAAARLARYWSVRKEIFQERWLLPMNQTGRGALSPESVAILRSGYLTCLQSPPIIFSDYALLPPGSKSFQLAVIFYLISVNSCEAFQTEGITIFHIISGGHRPMVMPMNESFRNLQRAMPARVKRIVIARTFEEGKEHLLDYRVFEQKLVAASHHQKNKPIQCIAANSVDGTRRLLEEQGFSRTCLPRVLGGDFDRVQFLSEWVRSRLSIEDIMASASPIPNQNLQAFLPTRCGSSVGGIKALAVAAAEAAVAAVSAPPKRQAGTGALIQRRADETNEDFHRRRSTFYSQRSAQKGKHREFQLEVNQRRLEFANMALREQNRQLESALMQARLLVAMYTGGYLHTVKGEHYNKSGNA